MLVTVAGCQNTGTPSDGKPVVKGGTPPVVTPLPQPTPAPAPAPQATPSLPPAPGAVTLTPPPGVVDPIRVALLVPMSGPNAPLGRTLLDGALLALFRIAERDFVLTPFDTKGTPDGAAEAARKAVGEGAQLLIGPVFSSGVRAAAPVAAQANINMLALSNDSAVAGPGVYLSGVLPELQVERVVRYASQHGVRRFAALIPEGPLGNRVRTQIQKTLGELGLEPARIVVFAGTTAGMGEAVRLISDYDERHAALLSQRRQLEAAGDEVSRRTLDRLKGLETYGPPPFDGLFVAASGTQLTEMAAQLANYDIDTKRVRLLGLSSWIAPSTGRDPKLIGGWFAVEPRAVADDFKRDFKAMYGSDPHPLSSAAFDLTALAAILAQVRSGARFDRDALTHESGFAGISGLFRFLPNGLPERGLEVREVELRGSKVVDPAPKSFDKVIN